MKPILFTFLLLTALWGSSCRKTADIDPIEVETPTDTTEYTDDMHSSAPGFGNSVARPQGALFVYPAGIRVIGKPTKEFECLSEAIFQKRVIGSGGAVNFCISFQNTTDSPIKIEFPPKTVWIAEKLSTQNGITLKWIRLLIPARSTVVYNLNAFCINSARSPTDYLEHYEGQPVVSNHANLNELVQLVAGKKFDFDDYGGYSLEYAASEAYQKAFIAGQIATANVAHEGRLTTEARQRIAALPDIK